METKTLTRKQLYDLVWSEPLRTLAPKYGVSDAGLAKICRRMKIPLPGRGHWQKKRHGHRVRKTPLRPLPKDSSPDLAEVTLPPYRPVRSLQVEETGPVADQRRFEAKPENSITVPERVGRYHPLVRETRRALKNPRHRVTEGRKTRPLWRLDVNVSDESARRALLIFDTLIKALEKRGFSVRVKDEDRKRETLVQVGEVELPIRIRERQREVELPPSDWEVEWAREEGREPRPRRGLEPSGRLYLEIDDYRAGRVRKSWGDGKKQRVEDLLNSFVVGLVAAAEGAKAWEERQERRRLQEEEARRRRWEEQRRKELEDAKVKHLMEQANAWDRCRRIREYVAARRGVLQDGVPADEGEEEWLEWAEGYADRIDPIRNPKEFLPPERHRYYGR